MAVVVRTRRRNISLVTLVWLVVGVIVAAQKGYITSNLVKLIIEAILAIVLWPLALLGINLRF